MPERAITILHVAESFAGGTLTSVSRLTRGLGLPFRHIVLHGVREDTTQDYAARFMPQIGLIRWRIERNIGACAFAAMRHLREVVGEQKPDIVHAHSSKAGLLVRLSGVWRSARVLYSPRGYPFQRADVVAPVRVAFWLAEAALARTPHLTVACGENELRMARGLTPQAVKIDNMVALEEIGEMRARGMSNGPLRVAMLGHIAPAKNFPLLVGIARSCPDMVFTWVGGGDVPPGLSPPPNFRLTGMLPHGQALTALAENDVYIHTSRWEGLSNAILEAMALALPVVVSPVSREVVCTEPGLSNGVVCVLPADYVRALRMFAADRPMIAAAGLNSRRLVEQRYAPDIVLEKWRALYSSESGRS